MVGEYEYCKIIQYFFVKIFSVFKNGSFLISDLLIHMPVTISLELWVIFPCIFVGINSDISVQL